MLPQIRNSNHVSPSLKKLNLGGHARRNVSEAHDVLLANQKNSFLLNRDPMKIQNQKLLQY